MPGSPFHASYNTFPVFLGKKGAVAAHTDGPAALHKALAKPSPDRILVVAQALRHGMSVADICAVCKYDPWFVDQIAGLIAVAMMFLAPVFYPLSALPEAYRHWLFLNPVTLPVEQARAALFAGVAPDARALLFYYAAAIAAAFFGYAWFQKSRRGFADVL